MSNDHGLAGKIRGFDAEPTVGQMGLCGDNPGAARSGPRGEDPRMREIEDEYGSGLTAIGMALGLPAPRVGATWGVPEILARIQAGDTAPGLVVDGDVLRDVIAESVPRLLSDGAAGEIADAVLDGAMRAGMTVLRGPDSTPRAARSAS